MSILQQVQLRARLMSRELTEGEQPLLEAAAMAAMAELTQNLLENVSPEDCGDNFITAAAMLALANMSQMGDGTGVEHLKVGDLTVSRHSGSTAASCLRFQAFVLMGPNLKPGVAFMGV